MKLHESLCSKPKIPQNLRENLTTVSQQHQSTIMKTVNWWSGYCTMYSKGCYLLSNWEYVISFVEIQAVFLYMVSIVGMCTSKRSPQMLPSIT